MKKTKMILCMAAAVAVLYMAGCGQEMIEESEMAETMTQAVMETATQVAAETTTEAPRPEPSFAAQLKAAEDLEQLIIVEAHSRDGITATVTMHEKQDGIWTEILNVDGYLGYGGIDKEREGDGKTPTGLYGLSVAFGKKEDPGSLPLLQRHLRVRVRRSVQVRG